MRLLIFAGLCFVAAVVACVGCAPAAVVSDGAPVADMVMVPAAVDAATVLDLSTRLDLSVPVTDMALPLLGRAVSQACSFDADAGTGRIEGQCSSPPQAPPAPVPMNVSGPVGYCAGAPNDTDGMCCQKYSRVVIKNGDSFQETWFNCGGAGWTCIGQYFGKAGLFAC